MGLSEPLVMSGGRSPLRRLPRGRFADALAIAILIVQPAVAAVAVTLSVSLPEKAGTVAVVVARNSTDQPVSLDLVPSFELSPCGSGSADSFWAPFSFDASHRRLPANARSKLSIPARASVTEQIDLAALSWGRVISSEWPSRQLREVVPPGCYKLVVVGELKDGARLKSTRWRMTLK